jgi:Domain of unknown function (DUF929)
MSPQKRRPQARKGRTAAAARAGGRRTDRTALIAAIVIIAVGGSLVFAFAQSASKKRALIKGDAPAPSALVSKVTGVPDSVITQVGLGTATAPRTLPGPTLMKDGKPLVVYIGAEYCPYCATERWAMVNAFSRFGTFKNLKITQSASAPEVFPDTPTFSFHGSTYTSKYVVFEPVETATNTHGALETPTAQQTALENKYNAPPYVASSSAGAIPFIDLANRYLISGASYGAGVLSGKTHDEIASAMSDASSDISQGAIGTANGITAAICVATGNKPANVCNNTAIKSIQTDIGGS